MKIKLVSVESGINAIGFRRIAAVARYLDKDVDICFIPTDNLNSMFSRMFPDNNACLNDYDVLQIAHYLAKSDIVGFSSMTIASKYVEKICVLIKQFNPKCKLIWGGAHPTLYPGEAKKFVDEVCIGEGEKYIARLLNYDISVVNEKTNVSEPLQSFQGYDCNIYDHRLSKFRQLTKADYAVYNGTLFRTIWTIGCPYGCAYCANDALGKIDSDYKKLRYPPVDWIIEEVAMAIKQYPFITTVAFDDDNLISLPLDIIVEFCVKWVKNINKPFVVYGMHPNTVDYQKVDRLAQAGMNRVRMGIQSGSKHTLDFYNRPTTPSKITESANILVDACNKYNMVPPAFDIITDNPDETSFDLCSTLELLYKIKRPHTLTIFSLRVFPKTKLYEHFRDSLRQTHYLDTLPTMYNIALYVLATFKPPRWLLDKMMIGLWDCYPKLYHMIKFIYHVKRGLDHVLRGDFSRIGGKWGYWIWKSKK